ncbi:MAG: HAD family hydrolase [Actinomycetota bacterium]
MIKIVFFDAGGTILDPHPSFAELFAQVCAENDVTVTPQQVREVQERIAPHLVELLEEAGLDHGPTLSREASHRFWTFTYRRFLEELNLRSEGLALKLYDRFSDPASYRLYEDVVPTLRELSDTGLRLGLISNFDGWLESMLVEMEVGETFEVAVISGVEGIEKPDPGIYRLALARAQVDPSEAVHVGDSPVMDIEPSQDAGMKPVLLDRTGRYADRDRTIRIETLYELPEVVQKL